MSPAVALIAASMLASSADRPLAAEPDDGIAAAPAAGVVPPAAAPGGWFGWQVALVDAGAVALIAGGGALTSTASGFWPLPALGAATYLAGGPAVHLAHHDGDGALRSVLLRVAIPVGSAAVLGGIAALTTPDRRSDLCSGGQRACAAVFGGVVGFGAGMIGAMIADAITAREPARAREAATRSPDVRWAPLLAARSGGALVGVAGVF